MEKNKFLSFLFALFPGAGEMYMGMMRKGSALMMAFFMFSYTSGLLHIGLLSWICPVIWFYSFFETINMSKYSRDYRMEIDEDFCEQFKNVTRCDFNDIFKKRNVVLGIVLIFIGVYSLVSQIFYGFINRFAHYFPWIWDIYYRMPTVIVAFIIIFIGIRLIKGGDKDKKTDEEFIEYKGEENDEN